MNNKFSKSLLNYLSLILLVSMAGCVSMEKYQAKVAESEQYQIETEKLTQQINALSVRLGKVTKESHNLKKTKRILEADLDAKKKRLTVLNHKVAELSAKLETMTTDNTELTQKRSQLEIEVTALRDHMEELQENVTALVNTLETKKVEREKLITKLSKIKQRLETVIVTLE